ncbi:hypothetical protein NDU88_001914 [Pleurodeles waltl]|uniref:Uncharacterized protein n=1 Tax=Pleurodeles waltl TaxID=8319 RepID=A0AAV7U7S5_PLEWA|nr:hypothetical protein NDU88_001914 [Pleurodeles waltl]
MGARARPQLEMAVERPPPPSHGVQKQHAGLKRYFPMAQREGSLEVRLDSFIAIDEYEWMCVKHEAPQRLTQGTRSCPALAPMMFAFTAQFSARSLLLCEFVACGSFMFPVVDQRRTPRSQIRAFCEISSTDFDLSWLLLIMDAAG